jgi:DNA-binding beta-propeller fold protein YncE
VPPQRRSTVQARRRRPERWRPTADGLLAVAALACLAVTGCAPGQSQNAADPSRSAAAASSPPSGAAARAGGGTANVYAAQAPGALASFLRAVPARVYVPNSNGSTVTVIDPHAMRVIDTFRTGKAPQHVVPAYDLKTLWVNNNGAGTLTAIDPMTGKPGRTVSVADPYNMYYTPDGAFAVVMQEARRVMQFLHADTMTPAFTISVPDCAGVNHMDFTPDGRYGLASCEFAGRLEKVDLVDRKAVGSIDLGVVGGMPQDVRLSADGSRFYVADMMAGGMHVVTAEPFTKVGFIPTGVGAHGLYPSRDGTKMYVTNRGTTTVAGQRRPPGSVSVFDFASQKVVATWTIPGGGSPDMGNLSVDGSQLWLSGRYDDVVYAFDTVAGKLLATIPVGAGPHGLTYWPQPGRFSLGHTGNMR